MNEDGTKRNRNIDIFTLLSGHGILRSYIPRCADILNAAINLLEKHLSTLLHGIALLTPCPLFSYAWTLCLDALCIRNLMQSSVTSYRLMFLLQFLSLIFYLSPSTYTCSEEMVFLSSKHIVKVSIVYST